MINCADRVPLRLRDALHAFRLLRDSALSLRQNGVTNITKSARCLNKVAVVESANMKWTGRRNWVVYFSASTKFSVCGSSIVKTVTDVVLN